MATKAELTQQAMHEMEMATITPEEWCRRIQYGYNGKPYNYKVTHNYKGQDLLYQAAKMAPPKPPQPPSGDLSDVQRCLFLTGDTSRALMTSNRLLIATADPNYRQYYSQYFLDAAIKQNRLRVWCDCHTTFPETALAWMDQLGLPHNYFYGECESAAAFEVAYNMGCRKMIGNLSVLDDRQITVVRAGVVHITNETYFNVNPNYRVDWRNANAGVGSNCMAVYASTTEGAEYFSLEAQANQGKYNPGTDCVYVAGFAPDDWNYVIAH
jgi:hypothetical protein